MSHGTRATVALDKAGINYQIHQYHHDPKVKDFGHEVVAALGQDPNQVFKTLLVDTGSGLGVGIVPVAGMLNLKAMASALGVKKLSMANPAQAEKSSGYVVGGISPIAQRIPLPTVIDETAELFDTIFVSAGQRGLQVELAPTDLIAITNAKVSEIADL